MYRLTLKEVLALPAFSAVEVRVVTGEEYLDREIDWVHASELTDIDRYLRGGELLLTAGMGFGETGFQQRGYIRRIVAAGAAALVVEEAGRVFETLPAALIDQAKKNGLPLVGLGGEVRFAAVSAQAHEELARRDAQRRGAERELESAFTQLLVDDGDHFDIVNLVEEATGRPAVLENFARQAVVYGARANQDDDLVTFWATHSRGAHDGASGCLKRPIITRGKPWGWLHVTADTEEAHDEIVTFAVDRAASAIAIALLSERTLQAHHEQRSTALITRLLLGDLSGAVFVEQARRLGFELPKTSLVVVVFNGQDVLHSNPVQQFPFILASLGEYRLSVMASDRLDHPDVHALVQISERGGGVSRTVDADRLPHAVEQAQSAAAVARSQSVGRLLSFDELGVERLLVLLGQGPELTSFVEDELSSILTWDATSKNLLLPTLRAFLDADGNKSAAAAALFVQRRTLYNRLDRISALLGRSLDDPVTRQRLQLALKGLDLLGSSPIARK